MTVRQVAREIGRSAGTVFRVVGGFGERERLSSSWCPSPARLSLADREEITVGLERARVVRAIARRLGRSVSTISREVAANGGRQRYRAWRAHDRAFEAARRPKPCKLDNPGLAAVVSDLLAQWWSPEEISRRLPIEFSDDPMMRVSHETIYKSLFVQGRGELSRELARCLRTGRTQRRSRNRADTRGQLPGMVMISERPAEVDDRAVPGHWEGDLIIGKDNRSAVGTLVERTTGYRAPAPPSRRHETPTTSMPPCAAAVTKLPASSSGPSPGTKAKRWPATPPSPSTPASRSTSATPTRPGSGHPARTPTGCCANTCPRAPTCPCTAKPTSTASLAASTTGPANDSDS